MSLLHFIKWFSCTDTLVLWVGSTIKEGIWVLKPKLPCPPSPCQTFSVNCCFPQWWFMLINRQLVSLQSCPGIYPVGVMLNQGSALGGLQAVPAGWSLVLGCPSSGFAQWHPANLHGWGSPAGEQDSALPPVHPSPFRSQGARFGTAPPRVHIGT